MKRGQVEGTWKMGNALVTHRNIRGPFLVSHNPTVVWVLLLWEKSCVAQLELLLSSF